MRSSKPSRYPTLNSTHWPILAIVALCFLTLFSCALSYFTAIGIDSAYNLVRPRSDSENFLPSSLDVFMLIVAILTGTTIGAISSKLLLAWVVRSPRPKWYMGLWTHLLLWWASSFLLTFIILPLNMAFELRYPVISAILLFTGGGLAGAVIGWVQSRDTVEDQVLRHWWVSATMVAWALAWTCIPYAIQHYIDWYKK